MKRLVIACLLLVGCTSIGRKPTPATRAQAPPSSPVPVPVPEASNDSPAPSPTHPEPEPEPEPEPVPAHKICNRADVDKVLEALPKEFERPELGPPKLEELPEAESTQGMDPTGAHGFFGSRDLDANGTGDRVLLYTSVDYWLWLLFVRRGDCEQFLGAIPGYKLTTQKKKHAGMRDIVALTYPLQGHDESYYFDGKKYVLR